MPKVKTAPKSPVAEIVRLHGEIVDSLRRSLDKAILIGELLTAQKKELKHGEFGPWIADNLPFTDRSARNYMRLFRQRARLKTENVSDLAAAYKALADVSPVLDPYTDAPTLQIHDDDDSGDGTETFDPEDEPPTAPEVKTIGLRLPVALVGEFEAMVKSLYDVFGTDNTTDTAIAAVQFAYEEKINAARLEAV